MAEEDSDESFNIVETETVEDKKELWIEYKYYLKVRFLACVVEDIETFIYIVKIYVWKPKLLDVRGTTFSHSTIKNMTLPIRTNMWSHQMYCVYILLLVTI